jgi:Tfp pilus assembly protein PilF
LAGLLIVAGCVGSPAVERAYEDRTVEGRFIGEDAYASFLAGAIAEQGGDARGALASYEQAAKRDPASSEIWTRVGVVRCGIDRTDRAADRAFDEALSLDPGSGRSYAAQARCALARGDASLARSLAARAAELDPDADGANALLHGSSDTAGDDAARRALVALTLTARDRAVAWEALATWSRSHGDVALGSHALEELVRIDPSRRSSVARAAADLSAAGHLAEARGVAAAAIDASTAPFDEASAPLAARLAVDEALARGDGERARGRATTARVPLEEVAARAILLGQPALARAIALEVAGADPGDLGARLVLAAGEGGDVLGARRLIDAHPGTEVSGAALVVFAAVLVHAASPDDARRVLSGLAHRPVVAGDRCVADRAAAVVHVLY